MFWGGVVSNEEAAINRTQSKRWREAGSWGRCVTRGVMLVPRV